MALAEKVYSAIEPAKRPVGLPLKLTLTLIECVAKQTVPRKYLLNLGNKPQPGDVSYTGNRIERGRGAEIVMSRPVIKSFYVSQTAAIISARLPKVDNQMTTDKYLAPWPRRLTLSTAGTKS